MPKFCPKKLILAVLSAVLLNILLPLTHASAVTSTNTDNFYFDDFTADYYLYRDEKTGMSRMAVAEEITAVFPKYNQNRGITRRIPFTNNDGKNLTMVSDNTIYMDVERNGDEEPVSKVEIGDGYFDVYIGDANKYVTGEQVYNLYYEFENVTLDHVDENGESFQELYWDSNGNDSKQRFNSVTARVHLDSEIADKFTGDTSCYVGKYGASGQNRCKVTVSREKVELDDDHSSDTVVEFTSTGRLSAYETLTFVLQFEAGTFAPARTSYNYMLVTITTLVIIAAGIMVVLMILALHSTAEKRKFYKGYFVKPEYVPLPDITVAEMASNHIGAGAFGDPKVATLIDLAVNHKIEMIKTEKDGAFGKKKTVWQVKIKTNRLNKQQASVLKILAGSDTALKLDQVITIKSRSSNSELIKLSGNFSESVASNLLKKGLLVKEKEKSKKSKDTKTAEPAVTSSTTSEDTEERTAPNFASWLGIGIILWVIGGLFTIIFAADYEPSYGVLVGYGTLHAVIIAVLLITLVAACIVSSKTGSIATHTIKGLETSKYLDGLKLYMKMVEAERLKVLQSVKGADTTHQGVVKIYEKLLPYAIIFKMEKSWLDELSRYYEFSDVSAPAWYIGVGAFSARDFSAAMLAANTSISSNISHSTVSNSSSGFSGGGGGGFAGGGGGGGGVGGW